MDPIQKQIIEELSIFEDWIDRYEYIIDQGRGLPPFPENLKQELYRVTGCQAQVWIVPKWDGTQLSFQATSDAAIVKGLIAILLKIYSGRTPEAILSTPAEFIKTLGLDQHLTPTRSNGLYHMLKIIFNSAKAYSESLLSRASA